MSVRLRAQARLERSIPDLGPPQDREPTTRIAARDAAPPPPRPAPGDQLHVHADAIRELKLKQPARPSPNAPLLMRIVRTPYALDVVKVQKRLLIEPFTPVAREPLARPGAALDEIREALRSSNPIRDLDHRPQPRPHPFARVRSE